MRYFLFLAVLALLIGVFNACSGAALRKQEILNSLSSSLDHAQTKDLSDEELEKEVDKHVKTVAPPVEKADPKEFNHFPYDLKLDTIAYMGYVDTDGNKFPNYFTFKAGAYFSQSGLRMSEYFLEKSGAGALTSLIKSSTTYGAIPYFSIAPKNYLSGYQPEALSTHFLLQPSKLIQEIVTAGQSRIQTTEHGDPIEASLNLPASYVRLLNTRDKLILHYKQEKKVVHIPDWEHPGGEDDIYGRLYKIKMAKPTTTTGKLRYIIQSITEQRLPKKNFEKQVKNWLCPASLRFEVRRHEKWAWNRKTYYNAPNNASWKAENSETDILNSPNEDLCRNSCSNNACQIAKKVLGDDWNINTSRKCISLKSEIDRFYNLPGPSESPDYRLANIGQSCSNTNKQVIKNPPRFSQNANFCPFFLSICVRK